MTVCLYLPAGRLGFAHARPEITSNDAFDAAGLRITVREPMQRIDVTFGGRLSVLDDPAAMADPKAALSASPTADSALSLVVTATAPASPHSFDTAEGSFAPNHYEQILRADGTIRVGAESFEIHGDGLRDHSWGPRSWQTPWFYRWFHGTGEGFGFMGGWFGRPSGSEVRGGFVWDGATLHDVEGLELTTTRDSRDEPVAVRAVLRAGGRDWAVDGEVLAKVPLRNRRATGDDEPAVTRIVESLVRWTLGDGRTVYGMAEYLDQIVDERPVGLAV
jgi:hypothetical protein